MNKNRVFAALLFILAAVFAAGFGMLLCQDYTVLYPYGSAPFYVYVIARAIELLLPAVLCLAAGFIIKRRAEKK